MYYPNTILSIICNEIEHDCGNTLHGTDIHSLAAFLKDERKSFFVLKV